MEKNKELMRRFYEELFNKGNLQVIDEIFDKNFVDRSFYGKEARLDEVKNSFREFRKAFPDMHVKIYDMIAEKDKIAVRFTLSGTHNGIFAGVPPTGRKISISVIDIMRIEDGRLAERWGVEDNLSLWQQLGKELK